MKKTELQQSLEKYAGAALVSVTDIVGWTGRSRDYVRYQITRDLDYITGGRTKLYYAGDVAGAIVEKTRRQT